MMTKISMVERLVNTSRPPFALDRIKESLLQELNGVQMVELAAKSQTKDVTALKDGLASLANFK